MKFLYALVFTAVFLTSQIVLSQTQQGNKYFNFVGSYPNKNCAGPSQGIGYVFTNNYCIASIDENWFFNISSSGDYGDVTLYVEGGGCGDGQQSYGPPQVYDNNKCDIVGGFSNETTSGYHSSIIQFTNVPVYESNSVVVASFNDDQCRELSSSVTYSNGLTVQLEDFSKQTYTCVSGQPFIKTCLNDGTHCTTKPAATKCSYQTSIFCAK